MNIIAEFKKETSCCFSGHRNRDLPFMGDRNRIGMKNLVSVLRMKIDQAVEDGYDTFFTGMAEGIDLICAELVHDLICRGSNLRIVCVLPFPEQAKRDLKTTRDRYFYDMLTATYPTVVLSEKHSAGCYKLRNRFLIDSCSRLIAVTREKPKGSGTQQTVSMARREGLDCSVISLDSNPVFYLDSGRRRTSVTDYNIKRR